MRRLFWVAVGAGTTVAALRKVREVTDRHVPAGARSAVGLATGLAGATRRAREEFRTATAEREAELRADLLAGADLSRSRATVDAWRADRAAHRSTETAPSPDAGEHGEPSADRPAAGRGRPGSARAAADRDAADRDAARRRRAGGSHRAEDPEDGPEGYSFF